MKISDEKKEIAKAMSNLQKELKPALKDRVNTHFNQNYATLDSVWEALREPLTNNGLFVSQDILTQEKTVSIYTIVVHVSGESIEFGPLTMPVTKLDCQGFASAISYGKRYALQAIFGVTSGEDDDGNLAAQPPKNVQQPQAAPVHKITPEQAITLKKMISSLPQDVANNFMGSIRAAPVNANVIDDIPAVHYESIFKYLQSQVGVKPNETVG
jgi:hypothetical protein